MLASPVFLPDPSSPPMLLKFIDICELVLVIIGEWPTSLSLVGSRDGTNSLMTDRIGLMDARLEPRSEAFGLWEPVNDQEELRECILVGYTFSCRLSRGKVS